MFLNCAMEDKTNHNKNNLELSDFIHISVIHSLKNLKVPNYLPAVDPVYFTLSCLYFISESCICTMFGNIVTVVTCLQNRKLQL